MSRTVFFVIPGVLLAALLIQIDVSASEQNDDEDNIETTLGQSEPPTQWLTYTDDNYVQ